MNPRYVGISPLISDFIDISNEKYSFSLSDPTVPGVLNPLTFDYIDNQLAASLPEGESTVHLKYFLTVPQGTTAGSYNNNILFAIVQEGDVPL